VSTKLTVWDWEAGRGKGEKDVREGRLDLELLLGLQVSGKDQWGVITEIYSEIKPGGSEWMVKRGKLYMSPFTVSHMCSENEITLFRVKVREKKEFCADLSSELGHLWKLGPGGGRENTGTRVR